MQQDVLTKALQYQAAKGVVLRQTGVEDNVWIKDREFDTPPAPMHGHKELPNSSRDNGTPISKTSQASRYFETPHEYSRENLETPNTRRTIESQSSSRCSGCESRGSHQHIRDALIGASEGKTISLVPVSKKGRKQEMPSGWLRETVPSKNAPDAVKFNAFNPEGNEKFVYSVSKDLGSLAISEHFVLANLAVNSFINNTSKRWCSVPNHPEGLGEGSIKGEEALSETPPEHIAERLHGSESLRVFAFPKGSDKLTEAMDSPETFSKTSVLNDIMEDAYGYADVSFLPEGSESEQSIIIELISVKDFMYVRDVIEAVMFTIPETQAPRVEVYLGLMPNQEEVWKAWVGTFVRDGWFNSPKLKYPQNKSVGDKGVGAATQLEFSIYRLDEEYPHPLSTVGLAFALREVVLADRVRLTGQIKIHTDVLDRIVNKYVINRPADRDKFYYSEEYDIYGAFIEDPKTGMLTSAPENDKAVPKKEVLYETIFPMARTAGKKDVYTAFVARSGEDDLIPLPKDAVYVVASTVHSLSTLIIMLPTTMYFLGPTRSLMLFETFVRAASETEDATLNFRSESGVTYRMWRHILEAVDKTVTEKMKEPRSEREIDMIPPYIWVSRLKRITLGEVIETTEPLDMKMAAYIRECAISFDKSVYQSDGQSSLEMPLFSAGLVEGWESLQGANQITIIKT